MGKIKETLFLVSKYIHIHIIINRAEEKKANSHICTYTLSSSLLHVARCC